MRILVTRFSALGDVTLCIPVLQQFRVQFPEHEIYFVSRPLLRDLFTPLNINFISADFYSDYKGIKGIFRLSQYIVKNIKPDVVIDLHNVLRSQILRKFLAVKGIKCFALDKGRLEKRQLTSLKNKKRIPLKHTTERYADVFVKAGFPFRYVIKKYTPLIFDEDVNTGEVIGDTHGKIVIGFAPFAKHIGKTWPLEKVFDLIKLLEKDEIKVVLFGGMEDREEMQGLTSFANVVNLAGLYNFTKELAIIDKLHLFVSMDSFNMHLASLTKTPLISIWGATHTFAGFGPIGENNHNTVEIPMAELGCRPCSIYGNRPCYRKDYACLNWIEAKDVKDKIDLVIKTIAQE